MQTTLFVGVDVASQTFVANSLQHKSTEFKNTKAGFTKFFKTFGLTDNHWIGMDVTGNYHLKLATFLYECGLRVSVVPGRQIKHFCIMNFELAKTDKRDAEMIRKYLEFQHALPEYKKLVLWEPDPPHIVYAKEIITYLYKHTRVTVMLQNHLHALKAKGRKSSTTGRWIDSDLSSFTKKIKKARKALLEIVKNNYPRELTLITSIPGFGTYSASVILVLYRGFQKFNTKVQVRGFLGMHASTFYSGESIKGSGRMPKDGSAFGRYVMFNIVTSAIIYNPLVKAKYERLTGNGKHHMKAKIACCNVLLNQAFAVCKKNLPYNQSFKSQLPQHDKTKN